MPVNKSVMNRHRDKGDYDLNDVVVYYQSRVYKNMQNRITSTIDEFTPYWDGAG